MTRRSGGGLDDRKGRVVMGGRIVGVQTAIGKSIEPAIVRLIRFIVKEESPCFEG